MRAACVGPRRVGEAGSLDIRSKITAKSRCMTTGFFNELVDEAWLRPTRTTAPVWASPPECAMPRQGGMIEICCDTDLVIWIGDFAIYESGAAMTLHVAWRPPRDIQPPFMPGLRGRDGLCLGLEAATGTRILARQFRTLAAQEREPREPVLCATRARYGGRSAAVDLWLWPRLEDYVIWICEWREQRVREVRVPSRSHTPTADDQLGASAAPVRRATVVARASARGQR
jgi:hypothetical protein